MIVYVDYNERNIILEDPERELGDLRRTTVEAAQKMNGNFYAHAMKWPEHIVLPFLSFNPEIQQIDVSQKYAGQGRIWFLPNSFWQFYAPLTKNIFQ